MTQYYSHGKLLLSGEYLVLVGAQALAVPCKMGQSLEFEANDSKILKWESWDHKNQLWFNAYIDISDFKITNTSDHEIARRLVEILNNIRILRNDFLMDHAGNVKTYLEFNRYWGLGTSSTLISNLAQWSKTNPYTLLQKSFGGSGYDIACATANHPLIYKKDKDGPHIKKCKFDPPFKSNLYFVYLKQKKNSREAVNQFKKQKINEEQIAHSSKLTQAIVEAQTLNEFEQAINQHELFVGNILGLKTVKEDRFTDFMGSIKSLGAWGGDFILATGNIDTPNYFRSKGFPVILDYNEMIL